MILPSTPLVTNPIPVDHFDADRLWRRCNKGEESQCWTWNGSVDRCGYPRITIQYIDFRAHRVAYVITKGEIPPGLQIDHLCRNRSCVNPAHLEAVDARTNIARGTSPVAKSARNWLEGRCGNGHDLASVGLHKQGRGWTCAQCGRDRVARYQARRRSA